MDWMMRTSQRPVWMQMAFGPMGTELRARVISIPKLLREIREGLCGNRKIREEKEPVRITEIAHSQNADSRRSGKRIESSKPDEATTAFGRVSVQLTLSSHMCRSKCTTTLMPYWEKAM